MSQLEYTSALRANVILRLGPSLASQVLWSRSKMPTVLNPSIFAEAGLLGQSEAYLFLDNVSGPTVLEASGPNSTCAAANLRQHLLIQGRLPSLSTLETAGLRELGIMSQSVATRRQTWNFWCTALTWAVAHGKIHALLPMTKRTALALSLELLACGCQSHHVLAIVGAVLDRHRMFGLPPPLSDRSEVIALRRSVGRVTGAPRSLKFPIRRNHVVAILRSTQQDPVPLRNSLLLATMTVCCLRASEAVELQSCDVLFDFDKDQSVSGAYKGTAAILVRLRKNDQLRKLHLPRIGRSSDRRLDLVHQLKVYMALCGIEPRPNCRKRSKLQDRCPVCPPLFPRSFYPKPGLASIFNPMPRQMVRDVVRSCIESLGLSSSLFSSVSARKGGLSVAIEAGVPEHILWMQSGHAQSLAARRYIHLASPSELYRTWEAFDL